MNEELKIIITAATAAAKKNLDEVKKKLKETGEEAEKSGSKADKAFKGFAKGAAIAVAAIGAVTTALVAMAERSTEFQKAYNRLTAAFQTSGSTVQQAAKTYKELFRFMGESDTATEAANLLVQLTNDEKNLAEWTTILQGAYAKFPDSLPVEALAEASNETAKTGVVTGNLADALNWVGASEDAFNAKLAQTNSMSEREALIRQTLLGLYGDTAAAYEQTNSALMKQNESQVDLDIAMASVAQRIVPLQTALNNLATSLLKTFGPAIVTVSTYLTAFFQVITQAVSWLGSLFGGIEVATEGATSGLQKGLEQTKQGATGASKALQEMKKQTMGFDELNVVSSNSGSGASGGASAGGSVPKLDTSGIAGAFNIKGLTGDIETATEKVKGFLVLVGITGLALLAWKISSGFTAAMATVIGNLKNIAGYAMIIVGALLLIDGYTDAWANGIDWKNLAEILAGIGLIVGGLALVFGPVAAAIGLVAGGVAMLVLGIKDFVENGYSMEAVIMIAVGAIAVLIGVIWAFNAALLANPITWIVVAIMALVAVFVILWNECEGFRNFWKQLWQGIKDVFKVIWEWLKQAAKDIAKFFKDAWQAIKDAWNKAGDWFKGIWSSIKGAFSAVGKWFKDIFKGAVDGIKNVFSGIGSFFSGVWDKIKSIFSKVGSAVGDAITNTVKTAINGVLSTAVKIINGFIKAINIAISVINAIPGVNISKLDTLSVPKLAKGGIVDSATLAVIGEQGKEAVVPLENNTAWMDKLADRLTAKSGASKPVYLMVDKKVLGQVSAEGINGITALTGQIPLKLY